MTKDQAYRLAKRNGVEKEFIDQKIGEAVRGEIKPPEENAQDRKMIKAIIVSLQTGESLDEKTLAEFIEYDTQVEAIKTTTKDEYK